jgi:hypothetical protein
MAFDLAVNQAPHVSTALPPGLFDALRPNTNDETVRPPQGADRRRRRRPTGVIGSS